MTDPSLWPDIVPVPLPEAEPVEKLSAQRRRTIRQRETIARGFHPLLTRLRLRDGDETCGTCAHRYIASRGNTRAPKCDRYDTRSDATDCRARWPACSQWEPT